MRLHNRCEEEICTKKGKDVPVVKGRAEGGV